MGETDQTGFNEPIVPDEYTGKLYKEFDLGETPSLEQVEAKATELLNSPLTMLNGAALVLGREVMADEKDLLKTIMVPDMTGADRFGALLMQKSIDQMAKMGTKLGK
ncbi:MAG: hypothetical protein ABH837_02355 [bacterium]